MAAKFRMTELIRPYVAAQTARLGPGTGSSNAFNDADIGKFVKLVGDSRYDLAAVGDEIEGFVESIQPASLDGYSIGGVRRAFNGERKEVLLDGLQGTPGTGAIAIGDYVLVGTVVARNTALPAGVFGTQTPRVVKATDQVAAKNTPYAWRVVSADGTAVGSFAVIEKV
jgi:hypothetical protein